MLRYDKFSNYCHFFPKKVFNFHFLITCLYADAAKKFHFSTNGCSYFFRRANRHAPCGLRPRETDSAVQHNVAQLVACLVNIRSTLVHYSFDIERALNGGGSGADGTEAGPRRHPPPAGGG